MSQQDGWFTPKDETRFRYRFRGGDTIEYEDTKTGKKGAFASSDIAERNPGWLDKEEVASRRPARYVTAMPTTEVPLFGEPDTMGAAVAGKEFAGRLRDYPVKGIANRGAVARDGIAQTAKVDEDTALAPSDASSPLSGISVDGGELLGISESPAMSPDSTGMASGAISFPTGGADAGTPAGLMEGEPFEEEMLGFDPAALAPGDPAAMAPRGRMAHNTPFTPVFNAANYIASRPATPPWYGERGLLGGIKDKLMGR